MDIPINTDIQCADGHGGRSTCVVLNPATRQVTHLVVQEKHAPHTQRLVPIAQVVEATSGAIQLHCTTDDLARMQPFIETEYIQLDPPLYGAGAAMIGPYINPNSMIVPVGHERTPPGEQVFHRGARVSAINGLVGRVDEFIVEPQSGQITHMVLREGYLWNRKDVTIPVKQISRVADDIVYLKLDKRGVEALPAIPARGGTHKR
jgi:sporulation protein YlmC with PRC-barrel domain